MDNDGPTTPPGAPPQGTATPANRAGHSGGHGSPLKRRHTYVADTSDVDAVKRLKREEVELQDRTTILRGIKPNVSHPRSSFFKVLL